MIVYTVVHAQEMFCMALFVRDMCSQPVSQPGPIHVSEEHNEAYKVDYIVASRIYKRQLQYLVHWKGYEEHASQSLSV